MRKKTLVLTALAGLLLLASGAMAQTGVMFVKNNKVGILNDNPSNSLHVKGPEVDGLIVQFEATAGPPGFRFKNATSGRSVFFRNNTFDTFTISHEGTGGEEVKIRLDGSVIMGPGGANRFELTPSGNLIIAGTLTQSSSREAKDGFALVDGREVLERVAALPLSSWSYKHDGPGVRHLGPVAEDFHAAFGLGANDKGISSLDTSGVALAAIQGLNAELADRDRRISSLERELADLKTLVAELAGR